MPASDTSGTGNRPEPYHGVERRSAVRLDPTCVHCLKRCANLTDLDMHLRFECEALGRKEQGT
jgi:hypothetical protein